MAVAVGAIVSVEGDSYCGEGDVCALLNMATDYTAATTPTEAQVLNFMANRAGEIYGWMRERAGSSTPGPASYSVTVDTSTDAGTALNYLLIQANAFGAAADALESSGATQSPSRTERFNELIASYYGMKEAIQAAAVQYVGSTVFVANHLTEGRVTADTWTSRTQDGFTFDGSTEW